MPIKQILIQVNDPSDFDLIDQMVAEFNTVIDEQGISAKAESQYKKI